MNCLSINLRGAGHSYKGDWVRKIKKEHHINFISGQETQLINVEDIKVEWFWDRWTFEDARVSSQGRSGGMFCIWNPNFLKAESVVKADHYIMVSGMCRGITQKVNLVNVYAPNDVAARNNLWGELLNLINNNDGVWLFMGDFSAKMPSKWISNHTTAVTDADILSIEGSLCKTRILPSSVF